MRRLILGGVRSGKSRLAEQLARASGRSVVYIATATAGEDAEMTARIQLHRARRPADWITLEEPLAVGSVLSAQDSPQRCLVVECLTLWIANLLWLAPDRLERERRSLCEAVAGSASELILVGNETGLGVVPAGELSRRFIDEAGSLHQQLAALCDRVTLTLAGLPLELKGASPGPQSVRP